MVRARRAAFAERGKLTRARVRGASGNVWRTQHLRAFLSFPALAVFRQGMDGHRRKAGPALRKRPVFNSAQMAS
eukprot:124064-Pleurochrysis_carterae.AAC.1